ncbi:PLP-dependent aminotransferase family protein [Clostridium botulinum]|uniref:aminotransferase-like domain-containing protein n=1 Tax=Clostridium TaxID=1485 RepID=UPI0013FB67C5|nr:MULTISPECIES: PLP-dependent aminotransferase family protein [Clostridium]MBN1048477.1 PLP-dependent aminotransferase family protein [Clostridium botulinum]MBN1058302.1 PLP-dependent aminotransferase family protein [Clostridium botulinum]MBN1061598.1 PLP-dependent aminotransferase family protein [Clostridium botulinum]MBN1074085.1 PLP-dependent aminotransferase family protein [Clostridium botulinum]MBN1077476.1 PLP-dependent aminotransferase family protein [Clostridium botulinum]
MIFSTLNIIKDKPIYLQIKQHIINGIKKGELKRDSKLPSTREVSKFLNISRNSVISAYEELESDGIIVTKRGIGTFIAIENKIKCCAYNIDYSAMTNDYSNNLRNLDIIKKDFPYKKDLISFKSIAPESNLFNLDDFKRALLDAWSYENTNLLNYGYAKGYRPLIDYFFDYMIKKRVNVDGKDILITNGFTEAFDIVISSLTTKGDTILCEKPTHNTAIKIMKSYGLKVVQVNMDKDGLELSALEKELIQCKPKFGYLIPSYNNPTGIVTKSERRKEIYNLFRKYSVPIIEDGFNEELLYSSSPIEPIASLAGEGNGIIYIGSLSKILFPGLRIGWIFADEKLIDILESVKRGKTIHSSFLDQSAFYYYLKSGSFNKYLKNVRKYYKDKYNLVIEMINKYIPYEYITGEGGLHVFIKLKDDINSRQLLELCYKDGVMFMPGDIFYEDDADESTFRIGFGRVNDNDIRKGIKIIGENINFLSTKSKI